MTVTFLSRQWLELARHTLAELADRYGTTGTTASMCEVFTDAPAGSVGRTGEARAAWHFRLVGTTCVAGEGEIDDADVTMVFDYASVLPYARTVIDPATAASADAPPMVSFEGDATRLPSFLLELHNRLAAQTA